MSTLTDLFVVLFAVHMKVFGGYLMRAAYELAWMTAASFVNAPVSFLALDALSFHAPVPIGAVLSLSSNVAYTHTPESPHSARPPEQAGLEESLAAVTVLAEVVDLKTAVRTKSNTFTFTFSLANSSKHVVPAVGPDAHNVDSYSEAMAWIEGKRRVDLGQELRSLYASERARSKANQTGRP
ncbi:Acyl-CoA thioesterase [Ceraceosorus bombacis]|uniref:Acyl-CoA thioesterase n=1 Tax=Ceraceosorus bombacis TaxID=401625 RepID=A0A0P1BCI4_9BASI|nr:Acyl-CoA thioesterase [Ceraceosorus bombacis]